MTDSTNAATGNAPARESTSEHEASKRPSEPVAVAPTFAKPQSLDMFDRGNLLRALNNLADQVHDIGIRTVNVHVFHVDRASVLAMYPEAEVQDIEDKRGEPFTILRSRDAEMTVEFFVEREGS